MSEAIQKLQRALSQAQKFVKDAPLEAGARGSLVWKQAQVAAKSAKSPEREQLNELAALALSRVKKYQQAVDGWQAGLRERAELFHQHEVERLQRPIAPKL